MKQRILILGGTKEATALARALHAAGHAVTTSLAGRTKEPKPVSGTVRVGGFGGAEGLAGFLKDNAIDRLIDATHPFAEQISRNAKAAAAAANVPLEQRQRQPWKAQPGDRWQAVPDIAAAMQALPKNARVLLALGSQHIAPFALRRDVHFTVRMIDPPTTPLAFTNHTLVLARPSADPREEEKLLQDNRITHIVCRNSGGTGAYAKIAAARTLNLPVIMIERINS
ncbi:MAG: cobalt-precorrin-6A reductase [Pseudomonadota bacterium]